MRNACKLRCKKVFVFLSTFYAPARKCYFYESYEQQLTGCFESFAASPIYVKVKQIKVALISSKDLGNKLDGTLCYSFVQSVNAKAFEFGIEQISPVSKYT